jgi:hypothetical protein
MSLNQRAELLEKDRARRQGKSTTSTPKKTSTTTKVTGGTFKHSNAARAKSLQSWKNMGMTKDEIIAVLAEQKKLSEEDQKYLDFLYS